MQPPSLPPSLQLVVVVGSAVSVATGVYACCRQSLLALAAMATLLYFQLSDRWLGAVSRRCKPPSLRDTMPKPAGRCGGT